MSEEDVSCEHEKMQNDETIIRQMCILFSLVNYSEEDKRVLTFISLIPNLQFDFPKAKKWFNIKKTAVCSDYIIWVCWSMSLTAENIFTGCIL